jgi:hypothetical protein
MIRYNGLKLLCGAMTLLGLAACSDAMDEQIGDKSSGTAYKVYKLNVTAGSDTDGATRALTLDDKNHIHTSWALTDKIFAYNCSDNEATATQADYSQLSTQKVSTHSASFEGDIHSQSTLQTTDKLAFFYPGFAVNNPDNTKPVEKTSETIKDDDGNSYTIDYHKDAEKIRKQVRLNLSEQDGTLATIDANYDYNWGTASPTSIDESNRTVTANVSFKRLVSFWGLKFKNDKGEDITNIKSVSLNGVKSCDILNLADGLFVGTDQDKDFVIDVRNGDLAIDIENGNGYVWIALFPEVSTYTNITVTTTEGITYTKSVSFKSESLKDKISANTTCRFTITNMKMPEAKPYVEVAGIKWATGNFIHYTDGNEDYWGIAPAQWWISNYASTPTEADKVSGKLEVLCDEGYIGSQNWYVNNYSGRFGQDPNDFDLFRWGDIQNVMDPYNKGVEGNLNAPPAADGYDISMKFFTKLNRRYTGDDRTQILKGDVVYYYTTDPENPYNHQYRYPKEEELKTLMGSNTIVPAYCYTDKGNKIYGAYFSDEETGGIHAYDNVNGFPTGTDQLWKYEDVTGLVLANRGLFLPMAGMLYAGYVGNEVQYRLVLKNSQARGQYWSSRQNATQAWGMSFGTNMWTYGSALKSQGNCIRPVYVSGELSNPVDASKYNMFRNILNEDGTRKY